MIPTSFGFVTWASSANQHFSVLDYLSQGRKPFTSRMALPGLPNNEWVRTWFTAPKLLTLPWAWVPLQKGLS